ncbi:MAG: hypothetical protein P4L81_00890 [Candidatus Pacebacteria bacterium]|nr:hypothetical protein [Candidatus Paceibacterota bacterium]
MTRVRALIATSSIGVLFFAAPFMASADVSNVGAGADAMCNATCAQLAQLAAQQHNPQLNCTPAGATVVPCGATPPGGSVQGQCMLGLGCKSNSASGLSGGNAQTGGLSQLMGQIGQLIGQLAKGGGGGGGSGSGSGTGSTGTTCTSYTPTSDPTQVGINPCVYYVPSSSSLLNTTGVNSSSNTSAQDLLNALNGSSSSSSSSNVSASLSASPTSGSAPLSVVFTTNSVSSSHSYTVDPGDGSGAQALSSNGCSSSTASTCVYGIQYTYSTAGTYTAALSDELGDSLGSVTVSVTNPGGSSSSGATSLSDVFNSVGGLFASSSSQTQSGQSSPNFPGVLGNILLSQNGATIFAQTVNSANNSETSGFYGSDTINNQSQGVVGQMCQGRPWASNFLANIIPPTFFDGLCEWGGYQVGQTQQQQTQPQVTLTQHANTKPTTQKQATTTAATSTPSVPPQAVIWAVPASVPLGTRTSVFWNTQGVTQCTESSPDGSFSGTSLSGAAATVPITSATTYTISCLDSAGNPITDYVTVSISN